MPIPAAGAQQTPQLNLRCMEGTASAVAYSLCGQTTRDLTCATQARKSELGKTDQARSGCSYCVRRAGPEARIERADFHDVGDAQAVVPSASTTFTTLQSSRVRFTLRQLRHEHLKPGSSGITVWSHCSQTYQVGRCDIGLP